MRVFGALREGIRLAQRERFRICHFSVQSNHVHMIVEARDRQALTRGVQGLAIRMARAINRVLKRMGKVWSDRYHRRDLATPREVRSALVYVLNNFRKHATAARTIEPCSSARWFHGWRDLRRFAPRGEAPPVLSPRTWLLGTGWHRLGLIASMERPRGG